MLGLTNRILAPFAKRAYVAWPEVARQAHANGVARQLGVPLRGGLRGVALRRARRARRPRHGRQPGRRRLNERAARGARARSRSDVPDARRSSTRPARAPTTRCAHSTSVAGLARRRPPFLDDVAGALARADLVVARSGAGTVAEIAAVGRAAVYRALPLRRRRSPAHERRVPRARRRRPSACRKTRRHRASASPPRSARCSRDDARRAAMANAARAAGTAPRGARRRRAICSQLAGVPLRIATQKTNGHGGASRSAMGAH